MARSPVRDVRALAGAPSDYTDPIGVIQSVTYQLIGRYAGAGGDIGEMQITVKPDPKHGTRIVLDGYVNREG